MMYLTDGDGFSTHHKGHIGLYTPMLGTRETLLALLTSPFVLELDNFLAASLGGAGRIRNVIGLNVHYCRSC